MGEGFHLDGKGCVLIAALFAIAKGYFQTSDLAQTVIKGGILSNQRMNPYW